MGYWNATCSLTNLGIGYGEEVKSFLVVRSDDGFSLSSPCDPDEVWCPIFPCVTGKYNDYGSVEDIVDDDARKMIEKAIFAGVFCRVDDWDDAREMEKDGNFDIIQDVDAEGLLSFVERGEVMIFVDGKLLPVSLIMVFSSIYDEMLKWTKEQGGKYVEKRFDGLLSAIESISSKRDSCGPLEGLKRTLLQSFVEWNYQTGGCITKVFMLLLEEVAKDQLSWANTLYDFTMSISVFSRLRKSFDPPCGAGSQDDAIDAHLLLCSLIEDKCDSIRSDYADCDSIRSEYTDDPVE